MSDDETLAFTLINTATNSYVLTEGTATTLEMRLTNKTGASIPLLSDGPTSTSTFTLYLPDDVFSSDQVTQLSATATGWTPTIDGNALTVTFACAAAGTWLDQQVLVFTLANACSAGPPTLSSATVLPANLKGNLPGQVEAKLTVVAPPQPGNLALDEALAFGLDNQGVIYRCDARDPLVNRLYLTMKNLSATNLCTSAAAVGAPVVEVSFVYGTTSGALADDGIVVGPPRKVGPAWSITAGIDTAQMPWTPSDPVSGSQSPLNDPQASAAAPKWTIKPSLGNTHLLGPRGSDQANVTFVFDQVISATPAGHTQMLVFCSGFALDEDRAYDSHLYVLDINKLDPPATRGVLAFSGPTSVPVTTPDQQVSLPLKWTTYGAASVCALASSAAVKPITQAYPNGPMLNHGSATMPVPTPHDSSPLFLTLQALDGVGGYVDGAQFTTYLQLSFVTDADGTVYKTALFGSTYWMIENYSLDRTGAYVYADQPDPAPGAGRLYDYAGVRAHVPAGWSLPTATDWQQLLSLFATPADAYAALVEGGTSVFEAPLAGFRLGATAYCDLSTDAYFWLNSSDSEAAQFSAASGLVTVGAALPDQSAMAVRYVSHA